MSHTPAPGANPFSGQYVTSNPSLHGIVANPFGDTLKRSLIDPMDNDAGEVSICLEQLPEFVKLKEEVCRLQDNVAAQAVQIKELQEVIRRLMQNGSGQRVNQTAGYWEERCY